MALAFFGGCNSIAASATILDHQKLLEKQSFWDNRDWEWYQKNIPFFDSPNSAINTIYYYRWELLTKHLTYGSPQSGYAFSEFINRPFWSGPYGAISCPAGHQLYEARWLRNSDIAWDFSLYWFFKPGAEPRKMSTWLADAVWAVHNIHPDKSRLKKIGPPLVKNFARWEAEHFDEKVGLFWQNGHDEGMELNVNSRQTKDMVKGGAGFRPTTNAYLWADAQALAKMQQEMGNASLAKSFRTKAARIKNNLQEKLWDPKRQFFFPVAKNDEELEGFTVKAGSRTHVTGRFAGNSHGRELLGYVPWQFNLPDQGKGYEQAWKFLLDPQVFLGKFGPTTLERNDPLFLLQDNWCCWWSGQSWPFATAQTLKGMANLLQSKHLGIAVLTQDDYFKMFEQYTLSHWKDGKPYLAEALHPDTGAFTGHDFDDRSEHYFHSSYVDLLITGLIGLKPHEDDVVEVNPLAPPTWNYFALENVSYHGRDLSIFWDRDGSHYGRGKGFQIVVDARPLMTSETLRPMTARLPPLSGPRKLKSEIPWEKRPVEVNFAVNNDGAYYPLITSSYTSPKSRLQNVIDGNYRYHEKPANRWTAEGSPSATDWIVVDFGISRTINSLKLYLLDDVTRVLAPKSYSIEIWKGHAWHALTEMRSPITKPEGHRANTVSFDPVATTRVRLTLMHQPTGKSGLTELEIWGTTLRPVSVAPLPAQNLAYNNGTREFPKVTASYTSEFDQISTAIDGKIVFEDMPHNRWTTFGSMGPTDWIAIDLGQSQILARAELSFYDDHGGVTAPASYQLERLVGQNWQPIEGQRRFPFEPTGGVTNTVQFPPVGARNWRIVLNHRARSASGLTELMLWQR